MRNVSGVRVCLLALAGVLSFSVPARAHVALGTGNASLIGGDLTEESPYYVAVQFARPYVLTHFTVTTASDMPGRDPLAWVIQGSNTGQDDDWTDVYRCDPGGRENSPLQENPFSSPPPGRVG